MTFLNVSQVKNLDVTPFYGAALGFHLRGDSRRMMMPLMIRLVILMRMVIWWWWWRWW